jgi:unsaturated rhamnogalacturonyl hydrolase
LGIAIFYFAQNGIDVTEDEISHIVILGESGNEFEYYYSAAWSGEPNGVKTLSEYKDYLELEVNKLNSLVETAW